MRNLQRTCWRKGGWTVGYCLCDIMDIEFEDRREMPHVGHSNLDDTSSESEPIRMWRWLLGSAGLFQGWHDSEQPFRECFGSLSISILVTGFSTRILYIQCKSSWRSFEESSFPLQDSLQFNSCVLMELWWLKLNSDEPALDEISPSHQDVDVDSDHACYIKTPSVPWKRQEQAARQKIEDCYVWPCPGPSWFFTLECPNSMLGSQLRSSRCSDASQVAFWISWVPVFPRW